MNKFFIIPGYFRHFLECKMLLEYRMNNPQYFIEDRIIDSLYDCPPEIIWNGGRQSLVYHNEPFEDVMSYYTNNNINLRHTFTNCLINPNIILDYRANLFVQKWVKDTDKVILNHKDLISYFKYQYPHLEIVYSTTLNITDIDKINELSKNNIYVLNYNQNNDNEFLQKLKYPKNIEVICAEPCEPFCPYRMHHYDIISRIVLTNEPERHFQCPYNSEQRLLCDIQKLPHAITDERIEELSNMGIKYFKISGRNLKIVDWIETMVLFLVKPEYRTYVRQYICKNFESCS